MATFIGTFRTGICSDTNSQTSLPRSSMKACFERSMQRFLQKIAFEPPTLPHDAALEQFVLESLKDVAELQGLDIQYQIPTMAKVAVDMTHLVYPFHDKELQSLLALYTAFFFVCDDHAPPLIPELRKLRKNILSGEPNGPFLTAWVGLLDQISAYYGTFSADMITYSTLEFMTAAVFEHETDGNLKCHPSAPNFPLYLRLKTGLAEPYVKMVLPEALFPENQYLELYFQVAPDLLEISVLINDLLSFYKESIVSNERNNYVYNYAAAHEISVARAFDVIADRMVECIRNVRSVLGSQPEMLRYVEGFIQGIVAVHGLSRFRLSECNILEFLKL